MFRIKFGNSLKPTMGVSNFKESIIRVKHNQKFRPFSEFYSLLQIGDLKQKKAKIILFWDTFWKVRTRWKVDKSYLYKSFLFSRYLEAIEDLACKEYPFRKLLRLIAMQSLGNKYFIEP